jgi:hypothetical protein
MYSYVKKRDEIFQTEIMKVNQKVEKCGKAETEMDGSCKE